MQNNLKTDPKAMLNYKDIVGEYMGTHSFNHLILEVVTSSTLPEGDLVMINPLGLYGKYQSYRA